MEDDASVNEPVQIYRLKAHACSFVNPPKAEKLAVCYR